jgi:hypothetical protein
MNNLKIKGELRHVLDPHRTKFQWGIVYVVLLVGCLSGLFAVASHIKTHTIATGEVQLSTNYSRYVVGEAVSFTITNNYNAPIFVTNKCPGEPLAVYRQAAGKWVRIHDAAAPKDCPSEQRQVSLPASSTVTSSLAPWHNLFAQPGKYRLVATVNGYAALPYIDFEVVAPLAALQPLEVMAVAASQPQPVNVKPVQGRPSPQVAVQVQPQHTTTTTTPPAPPVNPAPTGNETRISAAYTTAYTYYDNTPPGSADISNPILHSKAGGTGTYADPITLAVGHSLSSGHDVLDYPAGTRFYIPNVRRYFIVEDTCGDGSKPQNGPCHMGYPDGTTTWVDMWIGGQGGTVAAVDSCASSVTDENGEAHMIIQNPASNYVVVSGPVFQNGHCTQQYGNTPVAH